MSSKPTIQWTRRTIQAVSLFIMAEFSYYGIFRCPFAVPYVSCENCPVIQCPGRKLWLIAWLLILASALLFGRAFCGYACPGGMLSELLTKVAIMKGKFKNVLPKYVGIMRYVIAAGALYYLFYLNNPRWAVPIRTGGFFESTALTFEHAFPLWWVRTLVVLGALALGLIIPHFWCKYMCPTGALLEPFRKFSIFRYRMTDDCTDCGVCDKECDMGVRPEESGCSNCGACAGKCPVDAIELSTIKSKQT